LSGAEPDASYILNESKTRSLDGYQLSPPFTTDSNGNADYGGITQNGGDLFQIVPEDSSHAGWIGGFSVPQLGAENFNFLQPRTYARIMQYRDLVVDLWPMADPEVTPFWSYFHVGGQPATPPKTAL
jgi:hypothetical protein